MRFIIHGAGAIGSFVGAVLARNGAEVSLVARAEHAQAIKDRGLLIRSRDGDFTVKNLKVVESPSQLKPQPNDVIFLTVKSQNTADSVHDLHDVFPESTPVFCLQNGVRNEELAARRFLHVYGAMVDVSATMLEPGVVAHTRSHLISLGNYPLGCDEFALKVAERLEEAGFDVITHASIMAVKWSKLILNLNNATLAITGKHMQLALATPAISRFMADVQEEGLHVLETEGIDLDDPDNPYHVRQYTAQLRSVNEDVEKIYKERNSPDEFRTYPSTLMDLKNKRGETEAGYLNGEIILHGEKHGIPTPYNSTLLNVVETMAATGTPPGLYTIEELTDLVEQQRLKFYHS